MQDKPQSASFYQPGQYRPQESVGYLMKKVISSILVQADTRLSCCELTYAQWLPLYKLVMNEGHTMAGLARDLEIDPGAMTRSLDRLEAKGLVRRERSTEDRRVVNVSITQQGLELLSHLDGVVDQLIARFPKTTSTEMETLLDVLDKAREQMTAKTAAERSLERGKSGPA